MLVRFSSPKTGSITMFGEIAARLIKMLGATGKIPGAISAEDLPTAIRTLRQQLQEANADQIAAPATSEVNDTQKSRHDDEPNREQPVDLATRAHPLIEILERASDLHSPVMWDKV